MCRGNRRRSGGPGEADRQGDGGVCRSLHGADWDRRRVGLQSVSRQYRCHPGRLAPEAAVRAIGAAEPGWTDCDFTATFAQTSTTSK